MIDERSFSRSSEIRKAFLLILCLFSVSVLPPICLAQPMIKNGEKPLARDAGRVLKLQEIWHITDEGGLFYFKYPGQLKISPDGYLYLADENELLRFTPEGKFVKNLFKKGQGPGEVTGDFAYFIGSNRIYIYDYMALKIVQTDLNGELISQAQIEPGPYNGFYGVTGDQLVFLKDVFPPPAERKSRLEEMPCAIRLVSEDGKTETECHVFQRQMFFRPYGFTSWSPWLSVLSEDGTRLYVVHTRDYLVEALDLTRCRMIHRFKRKYPHVKCQNRGWEEDFYRKFNAPKIRYEIDIKGLFTNQDSLWVQTSTSEKEKGDLFDVFDAEGRFIDGFYLGPGRWLLKAHQRRVFVLEKGPAEDFRIIQYRIME
jgi:DNA-binding beta-propeller fold protein YncE